MKIKYTDFLLEGVAVKKTAAKVKKTKEVKFDDAKYDDLIKSISQFWDNLSKQPPKKTTSEGEVKKTGVPVAPVAPIQGKEYSYFTNNKDNQIVKVENPQSKEPNRAEVKVVSSERGTTKPGTLYTVDWLKLKPTK